MLLNASHCWCPEQAQAAPLRHLATQLGQSGYSVVGAVVAKRPDHDAVRSLAAAVAHRADPGESLIEQVGRAVLAVRPNDRNRHGFRRILDQFEAGMNPANAAARTQMVAAKLLVTVEDPAARWAVVDMARLTTELDTRERIFLIVAAHHLAPMLARAHELGVSSQGLLDWMGRIDHEIGQRLVRRVLTIADDIAVSEKIDHITHRLSSPTATGDDFDLVEAILATNPEPARLESWTTALGTPSPSPEHSDEIPDDWSRAWRLSAVLPEWVLVPWRRQFDAVTNRYRSIEAPAFGPTDVRLVRGTAGPARQQRSPRCTGAV